VWHSGFRWRLFGCLEVDKSLEHRVIIGEGGQKYLISKEEGCILSSPPQEKKGKKEEEIKRGRWGPLGMAWGFKKIFLWICYQTSINDMEWNTVLCLS